jgi:hypothetical protein
MNTPTQDSPSSPQASDLSMRTAIAPGAARAPRITLHIDELVLHGANPGDRHHIANAVQAELHRLLVERGLPAWASGEAGTEQLHGGTLDSSCTATASTLGSNIASAIFHATFETNAQRGAQAADAQTLVINSHPL